TADLDEIVRFPGESDGFSEISLDFADERDVGAIVLQAAAEHPAVALRDTDIVKHAHREAIAPVLPGQAAVQADIHAAVVHVVNQSGLIHGHEHAMMIGMGVFGLAAFGVPSGGSHPMLSAVARQMQVDAAAKDMVGIGRMNRNRVAVRYLFFSDEMRSGDIGPVASAVSGS